jgi:hypothetical protein
MDLKALSDMPPWDWPENASEIIIKTLEEEGASGPDALLAAEMAGHLVVMSDRMAAALLNIISAPIRLDAVRGAAAIALGPALEEADIDGFEDEDSAISESSFKKVQQTLHRVFANPQTPQFVRRRILEASVRSPQPWHAGTVRAAYADPDKEWQLTAVFCMQYIKGFDAEILKSLASRNFEIRHHAICAAGNWEISKAWPMVSRLLEDRATNKDDLIAAIEAAASINPDKAADLICPHLDSDDEDIAEAAMDALSMAEGFADEEDKDDIDEDDED